MMDEDLQKKLKQYVLWLLGRQDYSRATLQRKLQQKGADLNWAEQLLDWCESLGYLDEKRYCQSYIRAQLNKGMGRQRVYADAFAKGLSQSLVTACLDSFEIDWYQQAQKTYNKKFPQPHQQRLDMKEKSKRFRYMMSRGFQYDEIEFAIQVAITGE